MQLKGNQEVLDRNLNELTEMKYVLTKDAVFFSEAVEGALEQVALVPEEKSDKEKVVKIGYDDDITWIHKSDSSLVLLREKNFFLLTLSFGEAYVETCSSTMLN